MTIESLLFDTVKSLVSNRVYPDVAPEGVTRPYITYQQVGGMSINFVDVTVPSKRNSIFQINVWSDRRMEAASLMKQVSDALRINTAMQTTVLVEPVATYDEVTQMRGARQNFSFWS